MSGEMSFALFVLNGQRYALPLELVSEIISLPELAVVPDAPRHLAGVLDLHATIVPVFDLSTWLGRTPERYFLTDSVIVLRGNHGLFGIIVNDVTDVCAALRQQPVSGRESSGISSLVGAVGRVDQETVLLLDCQLLDRLAKCVQDLVNATAEGVNPLEPGERTFFRNIPPGERADFRRRAVNLMIENRVPDRTGFVPLAVVELNGEYFGLPLDCVREFAEARNITPVPCCPEHILGNMNLRGEVLTVIDVRPALNMPASKTVPKRIIVLEHEGLTVGVTVDEIYEVIHVDPTRISSRQAGSASSAYGSGTAPYGNRVLTIIDAPKLLGSADLIVDEEVF